MVTNSTEWATELKAGTAIDLPTLEQLRAICADMLTSAELGDWDAVLNHDHKRLQLLQNQDDNPSKDEDQLTRKKLTDEIFVFNKNINELANKERKSVMNQEIRSQAQVAAQVSYKQALTPETGL